MRIVKITLIGLLSFTLIVSAGYLYASSGVKSTPGYAKLLSPNEIESADAMFSMNLGPRGVKPVRWVIGQIAKRADGELEVSEKVLMGLLQSLQGVQLRVYEVHNNRGVYDEAIADSALALRNKSWDPLVKVRDGDEHIVVMQYQDGEQIAGLSIMASTPENAVFLNLIGPFDPETIVETASRLH